VSEIAPEAYFDALVILCDAPSSAAPMSVIEMHLFSYLGCILALFQGKSIGEWGYSYSITSEGFPFSPELEDARKAILNRGLININNDGLLSSIQPQLNLELEVLLKVKDWGQRRLWMKSSTECALVFPLGSIRYAISQTPGMLTANKLRQRSKLLENHDITKLYDEYGIVSQVLGTDNNDVLAPAVIWLSARILQKDSEVGN